MSETTRLLLGAVPAAFHAGVQDILLIAFGLAWAEFLGTAGAPIGIDVEGHGRHEELAPNVDLSRTVGWFTTKYPVALSVGGLNWAQVLAGDRGARVRSIKDAKEQLRALPDGLTYGLLRYLNPDVDLAGADPAIGFNYLGRLGAARPNVSGDLWRVEPGRRRRWPAPPRRSRCRWCTPWNSTPAPSTPTPARSLHANWTWAPSALDDEPDQPAEPIVVRGPDRHLRTRTGGGGGGLTPSDIAAGAAEPAADRRAVAGKTGSPTCCR